MFGFTFRPGEGGLVFVVEVLCARGRFEHWSILSRNAKFIYFRIYSMWLFGSLSPGAGPFRYFLGVFGWIFFFDTVQKCFNLTVLFMTQHRKWACFELYSLGIFSFWLGPSRRGFSLLRAWPGLLTTGIFFTSPQLFNWTHLLICGIVIWSVNIFQLRANYLMDHLTRALLRNPEI